MRKRETIIQEVTDSYSKEPLIYSDEQDFLGVDDRDQKIAYVSDDQVLVARQLLAGKSSGSKLHCYSYGSSIHYHLDRIGYDNPTFTLTHTFMLIDGRLSAISNIDNETFLQETKYYANDPMNRYEMERRAISRDEWNRVRTLFDLYKDDKEVAGNKLRHRQKHYRIFEIVDYDEEESSSKRIVKMTHTFYRINNKLYALAGNGHNISGAFGKVKIARQYPMQSNEANHSEAELVVLKIPKKYHTLFREVGADIKLEYALYQTAGLCDATVVKQKLVAANGPQEICVMRFLHGDLFDNVAKGHLRKLVSHIKSADSLSFRKELLVNLIRSIADIFLKLLNQLYININQYQFLHRDIKPENIVLTTRPQINTLGQVVSIECVEALFIDFGLAKKILKPGEWSVSNEHPVGTKGYLAPEINYRDVSARHSVCYTDKTEIYALGKTLKFVMDHLFAALANFLNNAAFSKPKDLYQQLIDISNMMCFDAPEERVGLDYVRVLLLNILWLSSRDHSVMSLVQKREAFKVFIDSVNSPFRHVETFECLLMIIRLTGVMIMRRTNDQRAVESKTNLSLDFFQIFCRLDALLASSQHRAIVLQLFQKVNHVLAQWDAAIVSPSPIQLFEQEIRQSNYNVLRNPSRSSGSSYVDNFVSCVALLSSAVSATLFVGGLFCFPESPARRERLQNNSNNEEKDNDDCCLYGR